MNRHFLQKLFFLFLTVAISLSACGIPREIPDLFHNITDDLQENPISDSLSSVLPDTGSDSSNNQFYQEGDTTWDHGDIEEYYFNQLPSKYNEIYRELYSRIKAYEDTAVLNTHVSTDDFWVAYYAVLADHPEFFWIGDSMEITQSPLNGDVLDYSLTTTVPASERDGISAQLEAAADACISQIPAEASTYDRIQFTYEYIINNTEYVTGSPDNQNIQSVLINRASVCAGYAKTFQYILHRMGLFCTYIVGTTTEGLDHAWNVVRIDDQYYNVDVTWGDSTFVNQYENSTTSSSTNYNYLCCTDEELYRTHIADVDVALPSCTDASYNYYRLKQMYYETYDRETIYNALMNSVWSDASSIAMKFGSSEAYEAAKAELFQGDLLQDASQYLIETYGTEQWNCKYHADDEFYLITIYWK